MYRETSLYLMLHSSSSSSSFLHSIGGIFLLLFRLSIFLPLPLLTLLLFFTFFSSSSWTSENRLNVYRHTLQRFSSHLSLVTNFLNLLHLFQCLSLSLSVFFLLFLPPSNYTSYQLQCHWCVHSHAYTDKIPIYLFQLISLNIILTLNLQYWLIVVAVVVLFLFFAHFSTALVWNTQCHRIFMRPLFRFSCPQRW